jgi:hypothetical protein
MMYRVVEVTSEEEGHRGSELVEVGPQARGWMAAKYCIYPQTVILGLESRTTVEKLQIMGHPWAVATKVIMLQLNCCPSFIIYLQIDIWIGDVPKGQEVDIKKAYFMKLGEVTMESNQDNDYIARQLQSIEVIKLNNDKDDNAENISRSAKELGHAPSPSSSLCCIRIIRTGRTSTTRSDYGFLDFSEDLQDCYL